MPNGIAQKPKLTTEELIEDIQFLDEGLHGATEVAKRTGFPSSETLERWLYRHDKGDLWLSLMHRDPAGTHTTERRKQEAAVTLAPKPAASGIEALLTEAENHTQAPIRSRAKQIRTRLAALRKSIDEQREAEIRRQAEHAKQREALSKIAELQAEIDRVKRQAGLTFRPKVKKAGISDSMRKRHERQREWLEERGLALGEVKTWSEARGMKCASSLIPQAIREAWDQDHERQAS